MGSIWKIKINYNHEKYILLFFLKCGARKAHYLFWSVYSYYENFQAHTKVWRAQDTSPPSTYSSPCFNNHLSSPTTALPLPFFHLECILRQIANTTSFPAPQIPLFTHQRKRRKKILPYKPPMPSSHLIKITSSNTGSERCDF